MNVTAHTVSYFDVGIALGFVVIAVAVSLLLKLGLAKNLLVATLRTALQLGLAGLVLGAVFTWESLPALLLLVAVMVLLAGREAVARQKIRIKGIWMDALAAIVACTATVGLTVTAVVVRADPWHTPSVFIPLTGMVIGNTLNGITLTLDRFLSGCATQRAQIEARLCLGASASEATRPVLKDALRAGMTPIINAMMIVGVISLPGVLTGQLLAGADPKNAVLYQMIVMYMLAASYAIGSMTVAFLARRRVFTSDLSLRPDLVTDS